MKAHTFPALAGPKFRDIISDCRVHVLSYWRKDTESVENQIKSCTNVYMPEF
jgi:hypothetical protein